MGIYTIGLWILWSLHKQKSTRLWIQQFFTFLFLLLLYTGIWSPTCIYHAIQKVQAYSGAVGSEDQILMVEARHDRMGINTRYSFFVSQTLQSLRYPPSSLLHCITVKLHQDPPHFIDGCCDSGSGNRHFDWFGDGGEKSPDTDSNRQTSDTRAKPRSTNH